jgi:hypothetical protein
LENINEEVTVNNNTVAEVDENVDENDEKKMVENMVIDDEDYYPHQNDLMMQKRHKKCCTKNNCLKCCRHFTAFMISRVGFLILMIGYVLAGLCC